MTTTLMLAAIAVIALPVGVVFAGMASAPVKRDKERHALLVALAGSDSARPSLEPLADAWAGIDLPLCRRLALIAAGVRPQDAASSHGLTDADLARMAQRRPAGRATFPSSSGRRPATA